MPSVFQNLESSNQQIADKQTDVIDLLGDLKNNTDRIEDSWNDLHTISRAVHPGDLIPGEDSLAMRVRAMPTPIDRISFAKKIDNSVDIEWGEVVKAGGGQTVNQVGGNLTLTAGTTARSETIIRSHDIFTGDIRLRVRSTLSQRIINQSLIAELVDVIGDNLTYTITSATSITVEFPQQLPEGIYVDATLVGQSVTLCGFTGTGTFLSGRYPITAVSGQNVTLAVTGFAVGTGTVSVVGRHFYRLLYDAAVATTAKFDTGRSGYATGDTTITTTTSAAPGHLVVLTGKDTTATIGDQLVASSAAVALAPRGSRSENVPSDKALRLQIRVLNLGTAPASNTTWTIGMVSVSELISQDVTVQDVRPMSGAQGMPVEIVRSANTQPISGSVTVTPANPAAALTGDTGAKTATGNGATQTNAASRGAHIVINVGAVTGTTPTLTVKVQGSADSGTTWVDLPGATTAAIIASGAYGVFVSPGSAPVAGVATAGTAAVANITLPRTWRIVWTITGTTPSFTLTNVQVAYIL